MRVVFFIPLLSTGPVVYVVFFIDRTHDVSLARFPFSLRDDLRKSRGQHSVSAYRHGLYIQVQACGCSAEKAPFVGDTVSTWAR